MVTNRIRSQIELCSLNFASFWKQENSRFLPAVSRFTEQELASGLPFYTEHEPIRFARNKRYLCEISIDAMLYAQKWMDRYNRRLEKGLF